MRSLGSLAPRSEWVGYVAALGITAAGTGIIALVRLAADVPNVSMLYLLAVLASGVLFGSRAAIISALAAFLAFNFFFIHPEFTFTVADEEQWLALGLLLVTGIVTGQLAASLRDRARETERREREAIVLYDVVRLMAGPELPDALTQVAERIRAELRLDAVAIVLSDIAPETVQAEVGKEEAIALIHSARQLPDNILSEGQPPGADSAGRWIKVVAPSAAAERQGDKRTRVHKVAVNIGDQRAGSLFLAKRAEEGQFTPGDNRLLLAVASQLGSAVERARLRDESTEAEVLRRTDELRAALLNAVSHDLRTPLSSIVASAGSLLQADVEWTEGDRREFAQAIEQEAERLDRLVGNLLDLSRIEAGSIRPEKGWYHLGSLIEDVANRMRGITWWWTCRTTYRP